MNARTPPSMVTLVLLTAMGILSLNMFSPSLAHIAEDFGADYGLVSLSVGGYLAITAVLQLILGPMSDRYGRRPVLLFGLVLFTVASVGCYFAPNVEVFLGFRLLQGAVISGMALSRAVIRDIMSDQEAASKMGYINMAVAVAPMIGPTFGGFLDEAFGWRSNFAAYAIMGAALTLLAWQDLGETNKTKSATFKTQFNTYPELFRSRRYWGYSICLAFSVSSFYTFTAGAPLVAQKIFGMPPSILGLWMGTITLGFFITSFIAGKLAKRYALTTMMLAGRILTSVGLTVGLCILLSGFVHPYVFFASTVFVGMGNGLTLPSANVGAMSVRPELAGSASGLTGALSVGTGAVVTTLTGLLLTPENGAWMLVLILLGMALIGLLAGWYVRVLDAREGPV